MCYNKSMKRIDVLKGIEQILVQKAYETGHISHRADGDWQKQADGSWIPYKGQSTQSVPQTQKPAENTEYGEIVQQDFESVPNSIKDKMFTIAQQYQSEWAEDSDEDIRSMAEDDVEAISQMLWDNADEETRNSWIGSEDLVETPDDELKELDKKELSQHLSNMHNQAIQSLLNDLENGKITEDQFKSQMSDLNNNITTSLNSLDGNDSEDLEETDINQIDPSGYANNINIDNGVADNDDLEDVANQILLDNNLEVNDENMNKARNVMLGWLDENGYLDSDDEDYEDDVEKSAVRDMRSAPTVKNMGF